jgi:Xaa-Pro aminopeptidase
VVRPDADTRAKDRHVKRERLLRILDDRDADAMLLTSAPSLAWYLDGARIHVSLAADPIVSMRVSRGGDELVLSSNERDRLVAEELPAGLELREYEWHEPAPVRDGLPESAIARELRAARRELLPGELARYRSLCMDAAVAATDALFACTPEWSERRLAAEVGRALIAAGADPLVLLVAGSSRSRHPHPLPTDAPLGSSAMLVICARRDGMIANLTRSISFDEIGAEARDRQRRIFDVEAAAFDSMRPGVQLREVLAVIARAYQAAGLGNERWRHHHQGGAAGYAGRDPRATPWADDTIVFGQAFSWNPWVPGAKVEDTVLLTRAEQQPGGEHPVLEPLTFDPRWPTIEIAGRARPDVMQR